MSIQGKRVLGITLARGGSKGIKNKNLSMIGGKNLIDFTIEESLKSKFLDRYIISTDSKDIKEHCISRGAEVPFLRPSSLASDTASSTDALQHAVYFCEEDKNKFDIIVELMCTNPFKTFKDIDKCIEMLVDNQADSVIGMCKVEEYHPARLKKIVNGKIIDFCVPETKGRRQDLRPFAYIRNGSIYALTRKYLMIDNLRFGGNNSYAYLMPSDKSINIDSPYDLIIANQLLSKQS